MHSFTVQIEADTGAVVEAQVVQAHRGMSLERVFSEVYNLKLEGRLRTEMLIVRLPVEESWPQDAFTTAGGVVSPLVQRERLFAAGADGTFARARDRAVHVLSSSGGQHFLTRNINPNWTDDPLSRLGVRDEEALAAIRKAEFEEILKRSRAVLMSPPGSMFLAPSGNLIKTFIRVGNIQCDRDAIDAVFFWLLPHLDGVGAILTDTWSISSTALNVAQLSTAYFGGPRRLVEMLPSYNDGSPEARARTRAVVERLDADFRATGTDLDVMLCLISATQTGSLAGHLEDIFATSSLELVARPVVLFKIGKTQLPALHDLSDDARFRLVDEAGRPNSEPIAIDPQIYFPLRFEDTIIEINKPLADRSREFFDRYVGAGLIEVHRTHNDGAGRLRHHAIHLNSERLISVPAFKDRFLERLRRLPTPPRLIVSPPHPAGRSLAELARAHFSDAGASCIVVEHDNLFLRERDQELRDLLLRVEEAESILIVDDVFITGARLAQYQRYIRTEEYRGRIDYLVGIARPSDPAEWNKAGRILTYRGGNRPRHTLSCAEMVALPDWRDDHCPWCAELQLYKGWAQASPLPERLASRRESLQQASSQGLKDGLFLEMQGRPSFSLGPESLFAARTANQAEVFAAVASALQHLRTELNYDRPKLGSRHFPISTVLKHEDYLCATWTDSILRATFLRAATADELTYADPDREDKRARELLDLVAQHGHGENEIALEVLLGAVMGKCRLDLEEFTARAHHLGLAETGAYLLERLQRAPDG